MPNSLPVRPGRERSGYTSRTRAQSLRGEFSCAHREGRSTVDNVTHHVPHWPMPTMNMRQLRDTKRLKAWLKAGKTVELKDRDRVIGRIVPERPKGEPVEWPDFEAQTKALFGDRVLPVVETVIKERGRY